MLLECASKRHMNRSLQLLDGAPPPAPSAHLPLLAKGFRPFFLLAGVHAVLIVPLWLAILRGVAPASSYLPPSSWHAHEMLAGFVVAVVAGFLLTAVGNWTQRETATGRALAGLSLLWLAGRVVMLLSSSLPGWLVSAVDLAFLPTLSFYLARPLLAANNRKNFVMLAVLALLWGTNLAMHLQALGLLGDEDGRRAAVVGVDAVVLLMLVIAGRVFPMFTRNATGVTTIRSIPWLDRTCAIAMLSLTVSDVLGFEQNAAASWLALSTGFVAAARAAHWGTRHVLRTPLLWVLHAGYGWLILGLLLRGAGPLLGWPSSSALHALTVGAIGSLTLGMMARVALGHTGRMLAAPAQMALAFAAISLSAAARVLVPLLAPARYTDGLLAAAVLWTLAFGLFLGCYTPILLQPRVDGKAG